MTPLALAACGSASPGGPTQGKFLAIAAENFWGSIATQLAGDRVQVRSIIINPATDPHSYTPSARDGELLAQSKLAIVTGLGYDKWAETSLAASPDGSRIVLDTGKLLGLKEGDNPHQWYAPSSVLRVVDAISADYAKLDPADAAYFAQRKRSFLMQGLAEYNRLRAQIRARYAGVRVGYSESIFQPLGSDLGLKLVTPAGFARAVAEGTEVTAADKQTVDRQAQNREIKVWVYNSQNTTPDVKRVSSIAQAQRIPIATVTETLSPASASFQQWQSAELERLAAALHQATGH